MTQRGTSLDDQSEKSLQKGGSDLHNPEESEDEGLDLTDTKDMFKDVIGILVFLEIYIEMSSKRAHGCRDRQMISYLSVRPTGQGKTTKCFTLLKN